MKVFVENDNLYSAEVKYIFNLFCKNMNISFHFVPEYLDADISIGDLERNKIKINRNFFDLLSQNIFAHRKHFQSEPYIKFSNGEVDFLSTGFYMINCLQEIGSENIDKYGRFKYEGSYQEKFNIVTDNIVQNCFDKLAIEHFNVQILKKRSRIFLSHDIDTIYGSLLQDGFYSLKKLRIDWIINVFIQNVLKKPSWFNIDKIMEIESEYNFRSTFYWLVNKGIVDSNLSNSDYEINSRKVKKALLDVESCGWENGLHKSASDDSFQSEIERLNVKIIGNRFHYLKFNPAKDFLQIEKSGLKFDSSLGFAEMYGFRNNYGLPYQPFNLETKEVFNFIECPLNIMDTTFFNYLKCDANKFLKDTIDFINKNDQGSVLSILFHNNYISEYKFKDYFIAFKKLLLYLYESDFKSINQTDIIKEFKYEY